MFDGTIESIGPRYCPSIEDKINRFKDKDRHQIFVEPEGWNTVEIYVNGFSSSLPEDVQYKALRMIPGFEEQLVGARSGEQRDLEVSFPEDYGNEELSGKAAVFAATVTAIRRKELPELDDDFAKDLGDEFETDWMTRAEMDRVRAAWSAASADGGKRIVS